MRYLRFYSLLVGLACLLPAIGLRAENAPPSAAETKLRETLRATMLQLRNAENDKAALQAAQAEADEKIKTLTEQVEKITKQMATDKTAADKAATEMQAKLEARAKDIGDLKDALQKLQGEYKTMILLAQTKEDQRAKLEQQNILLTRKVADHLAKNTAMFKIANDILQRYEKFGLGDALTAREPFTGITRVKLQGLFEELQDKIVDQRIKPETPAPQAAGATPAPGKSSKGKATPATTAKAGEPKPRP
jgi:chromosome segregation ATPase